MKQMCLDEKAAWKESSSGKDFRVQRMVWFISLGINNLYVCIFLKLLKLGYLGNLFREIGVG